MSKQSGLTPTERARVLNMVQRAPVLDIHTHLYEPAFGSLLLWGIDDLLTYHYLIAEGFRYWSMPHETFWAMSKEQQAELIWDSLFQERSPVSESCRGVVTTLNRLGLDPRKRDLPALRRWFAGWKPAEYVDHCLDVAGVRQVCMTNLPFDDQERPVWESGFPRHERFLAALRLDPLLLAWKTVVPTLRDWGYSVTPTLSRRCLAEVRRFLADWAKRIDARYLMVSMPPDFVYPGRNELTALLDGAILPFCRESGLPFAMMPGVRRGVNPLLRLAGDGVAPTRMQSLEDICALNPQVKFLATVLSRENQHHLCVLARKFRNLHIFGCWWFTNIPTLINEMTRMRMELLGLSVTPQHSDARVLDQLVYKWSHSREIVGEVLADHYDRLARSGWRVTPAEVKRDVEALFGGEFERFCRSQP